MNLSRLVRMRPDELRTRAAQVIAKRWAKPPEIRLIPSSGTPRMPDVAAGDTLAAAEKICAHRFDLLGYTDLDFGSPIDWHFDPVHGKHAPRQPWYEVPFLDFKQVGDHKIIWELNRHQHLIALAQACQTSGQERFRAEIVAQWTHWQTENPYPNGINWASTLEVAFRAISWLWVRHFIGDFHPDLLPALHVHGWYIERFLSTYFSPNTHLLGEGVALFAIGLLAPEIADASRWQARGWEIVLRQARDQVRPDGFHFEQSVHYHVYALNFFRFARDLAARNDVAVPPSFEAVVDRMAKALAAISQAGAAPNFGDDDGGRLFGYPDSVPAASSCSSIALPDAGIYAMTSSGSQLLIDAGPQGAFTAGHGHADALSIQLIVKGRPVLIDPGTFCYVCPERDRFRGTAAHNTVQIDGRDQARPNGPFAWTAMPETVVDRWHTSKEFDYFTGHHNGYQPVIHQRSVFGRKDKLWLIRDLVQGPGRHRVDVNWHFQDDRALHILSPSGHAWSQTVERWDWSPAYGRKEPAFVLRFSTETDLPAEFAVLLVESSPGVFSRTAPGAYLYKEPQGSHEFIFTGDRFVYRAITPDGVTEHTL